MSSRPDGGFCLEPVQPTASRSYLPDGLAWLGVTLARSLCLFSGCLSLARFLRPLRHERALPWEADMGTDVVPGVTRHDVTFALCWDQRSQ